MSKRHDAVFDDVLSGLGEEAAADVRERPTNQFLRRSSALAERASGASSRRRCAGSTRRVAACGRVIIAATICSMSITAPT